MFIDKTKNITYNQLLLYVDNGRAKVQINQEILIQALQGLAALGPQPRELKLKQLILTDMGIFISEEYLKSLAQRYQWLHTKKYGSQPDPGYITEDVKKNGKYYIYDDDNCIIRFLIPINDDVEFENLQIEEDEIISCKDMIHPNDPRFNNDDKISFNPDSNTLATVTTWHGNYRVTHDFFREAFNMLKTGKPGSWYQVDLSEPGNCLLCLIEFIKKSELNPITLITQLVQYCYSDHDCLHHHSYILIIRDKTVIKLIPIKIYKKWTNRINFDPSGRNICSFKNSERRYIISKHAFLRFTQRRNSYFDPSDIQHVFETLFRLHGLIFRKSQIIWNLYEKRYIKKYGTQATYRFNRGWVLVFVDDTLRTCYKVSNIVYSQYTTQNQGNNP